MCVQGKKEKLRKSIGPMLKKSPFAHNTLEAFKSSSFLCGDRSCSAAKDNVSCWSPRLELT